MLIVQIGLPVVFQPIIQRVFILLPTLPAITKYNIRSQCKDHFSHYNYQTNRFNFMTFRTKKLQIFVFWGNTDQFHLGGGAQNKTLVDFNVKDIDRIFVVFQPIIQRNFILLPRQPVNTKYNIRDHRKGICSNILTKQTDMTSWRTAQYSYRFLLCDVKWINSIWGPQIRNL